MGVLERRSLSRDIGNFPMSVTDVECQVIPFWTGYNSSLSEYRPGYSEVYQLTQPSTTLFESLLTREYEF
jgi:hypothetical protein